MAVADVYTLDTTYMIQTQNLNGDWSWCSQVEYTDESDIHAAGRHMFGGEVPYRVITIVRHAGEAVNPR